MIVRTIDENGDWNFGKGKNDYKSKNDAIAQCIQTRLQCFLGDCFFDLSAGIDWFTFLGSKDQLALDLAIRATILNTANVTGLIELNLNLDPDTRALSIQYKVQTIYSETSDEFVYDVNGYV